MDVGWGWVSAWGRSLPCYVVAPRGRRQSRCIPQLARLLLLAFTFTLFSLFSSLFAHRLRPFWCNCQQGYAARLTMYLFHFRCLLVRAARGLERRHLRLVRSGVVLQLVRWCGCVDQGDLGLKRLGCPSCPHAPAISGDSSRAFSRVRSFMRHSLWLSPF